MTREVNSCQRLKLRRKAYIIWHMSDMHIWRNEIDRIDTEMQTLFEERMHISAEIGAYKASLGMPVFDAAREEAKISEIRGRASSEELADGAERLFRKIMEISRDCQQKLQD